MDLQTLFRKATDDTRIQLLRYLFVGGFAFVVDFGTLALLTSGFGVHYLVSNLCAFGAGLTTNYLMSISWVFNKRTMGSRSKEFAVFALIGVVGLALNELIMWGGTDGLGLHYLLSKVAATAVVFGWNFGARKVVLFR